ncbi:SyrB-like regulator [Rhizobium tubonense]|uniref:SyrB-like regulator n=1 Tax=Rhizobium tubonense TaxID=484088 RepID=A0A2W4C2A6_9HYPH|nr:SyrB-like regulator [Rhizobium tubonense]PZM07969.1 SyrB-like regulator [Rhizobium tubonense]
MADENNIGSTAEVLTTDAPITPAPKKQRAKRRSKVAAEAVPASPATTVKSTRAFRKKSAEQTGNAKEPVAAAAASGKRSKNDGVKPIAKIKTTAQPPIAVSAAGKEMADLLQLEEENKRLRKSLSEKLRAENADLRKRLGLN